MILWKYVTAILYQHYKMHAPLKTKLTVVRPVLQWCSGILKEAQAARKERKSSGEGKNYHDGFIFKSIFHITFLNIVATLVIKDCFLGGRGK